MRPAFLLLVALIASACSREQKAEAETAPQKPSTIQTAVDGFTGKTAVKQGKMAQEKLEAVSDQKNKDLDEVM